MEYVYHGSKTHGIKKLSPHPSTHGDYVYATQSKAIAIIMSKKCGDDATYSLTRGEDGKYDLVERIPFAFSKMFSNDFSLYTLNSACFKNINTGFNEVVSDVEVEVLNEYYYKNLMNEINNLVEEGLINIYYFPDRPNYIPEDDSDLIDKIRNTYIGKLNKKYTDRELSRWIFLHPNLEEELRIIAEEQQIDLLSYEEIKDIFLEIQKINPEHEMYIDSALEMYTFHRSQGK